MKIEDEIFETARKIGAIGSDPEADSRFLEKYKDHQKAVEFLQAEGSAQRDYEWLVDYSKYLWEQRVRIFTTIDEKADSIIKYLGGGTAIFALGIIAKADSSNYFLIFWCLPAVLCSLGSILFAVIARMPRGVPSLPPIIQVINEYVEVYENAKAAQTAFLGQWNLACVDMKLICHRKSWFLGWATWLYLFAIALLILPLLVAAIHPPALLVKI